MASSREQRSIFSEFDPAVQTWVVSDLKSKLDLQKFLLEKRDFLEGDCLVRANELWRTMISRLRPDLQIVSKEFMLAWLGQKLAMLEHDWAKTPGAANAAYDYLTQLMPMISHPDGSEMMKEWFAAGNESAQARWGRWFDLSVELWQALLQEGFVTPAWAAGVLVNEPDLSSAWSRPLIVDLGAELDQVEADLFALLSDRLDVMVLRPNPSWADEYARALSAYDVLERRLKVERKSNPPLNEKIEPKAVRYRKYTTMLAEVKEATAQVRAWLDSGAKASEIVIAAPDIEVYWPVLSSYLAHEGVPTQKSRVHRTQTYPDISKWLSFLRLRLGSYAETDVELAYFDSYTVASPNMSYDRFRVLYTAIYGREDLGRSDEIGRLFALQLEPETFAARDEFVAWSLKQLPEEGQDFKRVEDVYKLLFEECPRSLKMTARRWLDYLERLMAKVEVRIEDGIPDGISCVKLSAATNSPATHMIVLGMTETALRPTASTAVLSSDALSLANQFGFHLSTDDQASVEFDARWIISDSSRERLLTVAETDFSGAAQAPSWLWVQGARDQEAHKTVNVPSATRWDETQQSSLDAMACDRGWREAQTLIFKEALSEDLGEREPRPFAKGLVTQLSPSRIEDYLECPSIFVSKYLFGLSDISELDLEVDGLRRGSLMHKLFEILTQEPMCFDYSQEEMASLVEKAREESMIELADPRLWPPLKERHIDMGFRFLAFEKENRARFPETRTVGREVEIRGYVDLETGDLKKEATGKPEEIAFRGRIDRIDADEKGRLVIYDYKSSASSVGQYGSWLKKNRIQLLLYAMAVQEGLTDLQPAPVVAALYYVARPFNRDQGYKLEGVEQGLYEIEGRKKNRISEEERENLFDEGRKLIAEAARRILVGDFAPRPREPKDCFDCQWRSLCRAPHLNS